MYLQTIDVPCVFAFRTIANQSFPFYLRLESRNSQPASIAEPPAYPPIPSSHFTCKNSGSQDEFLQPKK